MDLFINNELINYEPNHKSLGIYFGPKLKFNFHFSEIKKQLYIRGGMSELLGT